MSALSAILNLNIDIGIKNRKKMKFNSRHQFKNPAGDRFEMPQRCIQHHFGKVKKFECGKFTSEDALNFRKKLYRSDEKRDQNDFLYDFLCPTEAKSHQEYSKNPKLLMITYKLMTIAGQIIVVCKELFHEVTGFGDSKCRAIFMKRYKTELLNKNDDAGLNKLKFKQKNTKTLEKIKETLNEKKEKILNLQKGTFDTFTRAIKEGISTDNNKYKSEPYAEENLEFEQTYIDDHEIQQRVIIDLDSMETCRICLENNSKLHPIIKKMPNYDCTIADMIEFCLNIRIPRDSLPQKICNICFKKVESACSLKNDFQDSQLIMDECSEELKFYEVPELDEILYDYDDMYESLTVDQSNNETRETIEHFKIEEDFEMVEEIEVALEDPTEPEEESNSNQQNPTVKPRKCYLCNQNFETTPEDHFQNEHELVQSKPSRCTKCTFECEYPYFLNLHYQMHEDDYKICPHCSRKFRMESSVFATHKIRCLRKKNDVVVIYNCRFCEKEYKDPTSRRDHERIIHTNEKLHNCQECGQSFHTRISLRRHLFKHGIGASCYCENCGKAYLQNYELTRHQKFCLRNVASKKS